MAPERTFSHKLRNFNYPKNLFEAPFFPSEKKKKFISLSEHESRTSVFVSRIEITMPRPRTPAMQLENKLAKVLSKSVSWERANPVQILFNGMPYCEASRVTVLINIMMYRRTSWAHASFHPPWNWMHIDWQTSDIGFQDGLVQSVLHGLHNCLQDCSIWYFNTTLSESPHTHAHTHFSVNHTHS